MSICCVSERRKRRVGFGNCDWKKRRNNGFKRQLLQTIWPTIRKTRIQEIKECRHQYANEKRHQNSYNSRTNYSSQPDFLSKLKKNRPLTRAQDLMDRRGLTPNTIEFNKQNYFMRESGNYDFWQLANYSILRLLVSRGSGGVWPLFVFIFFLRKKLIVHSPTWLNWKLC